MSYDSHDHRQMLATAFENAVEAALLENFQTQLVGRPADRLSKLIEIGVRYVRPIGDAGDQMYHLIVRAKPGEIMYLEEIQAIAKGLDHFCECNDPAILLGDLYYTLGDGDDVSAVWMENGEFRIWLRGWVENPTP